MSKFINDSILSVILGNFKTKMTEFDAAILTEAKAYADTKFGQETEFLSFSVVATLPTENIDTKTIYLVPKATPETNNVYDQFMYINSQWEAIGDTTISLSDYYTKEQIDTVLGGYYTKEQVDGLVAVMSESDVTAFNVALFPQA